MKQLKPIFDLAKDFLINTEGQLPPTVIFSHLTSLGEPSLGIVPIKMPKEMDKHRWMFLVGQLYKQTPHAPIEEAYFIGEAWIGTSMEIEPSKDPKRRNSLIIESYSFETKGYEIKVYELKKNKKGKLEELSLFREGTPQEGSLLHDLIDGLSSDKPLPKNLIKTKPVKAVEC